jgi:hypothetical protein
MSTIQVQLPDSVLDEAKKLAEHDQIPLDDDFVALAITERVSARRGLAYIEERAKKASKEKFLAALAKSPDVEPGPGDRIE